MFEQYLLIGIGMVGVMAVGLSAFLMYMGAQIQKMPTKKDRVGKPSLSSPEHSTKIFAIFNLGLFVLASIALYSQDKVIFILGVVGLVAVLMFLFTGLGVSFAVTNAINQANKVRGI